MFAGTTPGTRLSTPLSRLSLDYKFWLPVLAIALLASGLRLFALGSYPQKFSQDEMVLGYDAWNIWQTGRDHHGELLPIAFRSYNDFVPPVAIYLAAPFVGILGLDEFTTRLPFAVIGIASVVLVAMLGRLWFGALAGILAALFLAIDPWHLNYSRLALPPSPLPFFTTAALYTFTLATSQLKRADREGRNAERSIYGLFTLSALSFALLTGSYATMKVQAPLLIFACLLATIPLFWRHRGLMFFWLGMYGVFVSPLLVHQITQWTIVQSRFSGISAFQNTDWFIQALRLYADHFNPGALLFTGFGDGEGVRRPLYIGELFWLEVPLMIAAFARLTRRQTSYRVAFSLTVLISLWFITYPVADSLTRGAPPFDNQMAGQPHELRAYNLLPLPELLAGFGVVVIARKLSRTRWQRLLLAGLGLTGTAILILFCAVSLTYFFGPPILGTARSPDDAKYPRNIGFRPIAEALAKEMKACDTLWITNGNQMHMYYLFYTKYAPQRVQRLDLTRVSGNWLDITAFDQVRIGDPDPVNPQPIERPECTNQPRRIFYAAHLANQWKGWREVAAVRNIEGMVIWQLSVKPLQYFTDGRLNDADTAATIAAYCLPDAAISVRAIDDPNISSRAVPRELFSVDGDTIQSKLGDAATSGKHQRIRQQEGRELWALTSGELQLHDTRGITYDYVFAGDACK
jgi:4-amino-4-deoxy-L-arabinose transferase-like glycosyltransferase